MIKIEKIEVNGWEAAIRGMRNPLNSWEKRDSHRCLADWGCDCAMVENEDEPAGGCSNGDFVYCIGENDMDLMKRLCKAGPEHRKYLRMITVTMDITAPLYWWKEFDTYKVGTVANSCSTMHTIHKRDLTMDDFSHEHLIDPEGLLADIVTDINSWRSDYMRTGDKQFWYQMIQLLPSSYNQKRTVMMNYENVINIIRQRTGHKLDEWGVMVDKLKKLPYIMDLLE